MNARERFKAILNYESYDRLPIIHFGFWHKTLENWYNEGHLTKEEAFNWYENNIPVDDLINRKLGFDSIWGVPFYNGYKSLYPHFETKTIEILPDGMKKVLSSDGVIVMQKEGIVSIPMEVDHLLKDRKSWEEHYLPRLQYSDDRINTEELEKLISFTNNELPLGIFCGSLFGHIRNWMGVEGISYLYSDDEDLYDEIINTVAELCYRITEKILSMGVKFDFAHFWEDICFKNGPLVVPSIFKGKVGPHYRRITSLLKKYEVNIVALDCDGVIDALIPTWIENGVNTMFPMEVGTWNADIKPWREKYGKEIRGIGGMNKRVFSYDYAAIDAEIERLKPLVELGGYIPCPDHHIPPDAIWENIQYYCDKMHKTFG